MVCKMAYASCDTYAKPYNLIFLRLVYGIIIEWKFENKNSQHRTSFLSHGWNCSWKFINQNMDEDSYA